MIEFFKGTVTPRDFAFVAVVISLAGVLCAAFYFAVYTGQQAELKTELAKLETMKQDLKTARETEVNIVALRTEASKMQQLVDLFETRLPDEREIPMLVKRFEDLGTRAGLRVQLVQNQNIIENSKETIPYKVTAQGNFHQIVHFINLLERDERYLKVSDLDIGPEEAGISQATFTLSTFRFIQAITPAPATTPKPAGAAS